MKQKGAGPAFLHFANKSNERGRACILAFHFILIKPSIVYRQMQECRPGPFCWRMQECRPGPFCWQKISDFK